MKDIYQLSLQLGEFLQASAIGTLGTDLFLESLPEDPVNGTVVKMTGGPIDPASPVRNPSFQIIHRNKSSREGLRKVTEINNLLNNQWNVIPCFPGRVVSFSEAGASSKDAGGRAVFSLNFVVTTTTQR